MRFTRVAADWSGGRGKVYFVRGRTARGAARISLRARIWQIAFRSSSAVIAAGRRLANEQGHRAAETSADFIASRL